MAKIELVKELVANEFLENLDYKFHCLHLNMYHGLKGVDFISKQLSS